jgi:hypothetical protein
VGALVQRSTYDALVSGSARVAAGAAPSGSCGMLRPGARFDGPVLRVCQLSEGELGGGLYDAATSEELSREAEGEVGEFIFVLPEARDEARPRRVVMLRGVEVRAAACGAEHTLALSRAGGLWGFGSNRSGQLGLGSVLLMSQHSLCTRVPSALALPGRAVSVACGARHSLAVVEPFGALLSWGDAQWVGREGDPNVPQAVFYPRSEQQQMQMPHSEQQQHEQQTQQQQQLQLQPVRDVRCVSAGEQHTVFCTGAGNAFGFGLGAAGQLGHLYQEGAPVPELLEHDAPARAQRPIALRPAGGGSRGPVVSGVAAGGEGAAGHTLLLCSDASALPSAQAQSSAAAAAAAAQLQFKAPAASKLHRGYCLAWAPAAAATPAEGRPVSPSAAETPVSPSAAGRPVSPSAAAPVEREREREREREHERKSTSPASPPTSEPSFCSLS